MPEQNAVAQAALTGDRTKTLIALRDRLAADIDSPGTAPRDVAALVKQLQDVLRELDAQPKETKGTTLGNITSRRNRKRPEST